VATAAVDVQVRTLGKPQPANSDAAPPPAPVPASIGT
jgi:hypothetical protein